MSLVQHEYHDYANVVEKDVENMTNRSVSNSGNNSPKIRKGPRGGVTTPFPVKLHQLLEQERYPNIIAWQSHGRSFILRNPKEFLGRVMPKYFKQTKLTSFQRQLNLYAFRRISSGPDKGAYYHELFLRGRPNLSTHIYRMRVKGTRIKCASCPESEPNFYRMTALEQCSSVDANHISEDETVSSHNDQSSCHDDKCGSYTDSSSETNMGDHFDSSHAQKVNAESHMYTTSKSTFPSQVITQLYPDSSTSSMPPLLDSNSFDHDHEAISFEGMEFHYLDPFDQWDACTLPLHEKSNNINTIGLSEVNGKLCGFEA
jgi:hypothetical protein